MGTADGWSIGATGLPVSWSGTYIVRSASAPAIDPRCGNNFCGLCGPKLTAAVGAELGAIHEAGGRVGKTVAMRPARGCEAALGSASSG